MLTNIKIQYKAGHPGWIPILVGIREAAHAAHHAQYVVVGGEHVHAGRHHGAHGVVGHRQQQSGVINTG